MFQYNNLMYKTLSYLPEVFNQSYQAYIAEHLFKPLNMSASTFSVAEAEARGTLTDGFQRDSQDIMKCKNGTLKATVPYFQRPGEERTWAGAGGVLTSARDLVGLLQLCYIQCSWFIPGSLGFDVVEQRPTSVHERVHYPKRDC
jgi:CubicO group peptidase (beta-lactamase class C family)